MGAVQVITSCPIYVSEEVLEKCGIVLPEGKTLRRITIDDSTKIPETLPEGEGEQPSVSALSIELSKKDYEKQLQLVIRMLMV
jgi:hypothetical protein